MNCFKKISIVLLYSAIFAGCQEEGPYINFNPKPKDASLIDTTYIATQAETPQLKNILIEDLTGVNCKNCPSAAKKLSDLIAANPGRIVGIAVHTPNHTFGGPFSGSKEDYRNFFDTNIFAMIGNPGSLPQGCIDRVKFPDVNYFYQNTNSWSSAVNQRLTITNAPVNIKICREFDSNTLELKVLVELFYNEANNFKNYLSVTLIENNIIDFQIETDGITIDSFYQHNHLLRTMMTAYNGDFLMENPEVKRVFKKQYKIKLKPNWKPADMKIVAYVSLRTDTRLDVFHVEEIDLK